MNEQSITKALENAYNNFDSRPLSGETLKRFYIDDFTKDAVNSIRTTIKISERFRKMLVIGHRGCGKSTILNKVAEELRNNFHLVSFSAADTLNMNDVETIDILEDVKKIASESQRNEVENKDLIYLLKYLFVLEYRFEDELWYDVHPCLKKVLNSQ